MPVATYSTRSASDQPARRLPASPAPRLAEPGTPVRGPGVLSMPTPVDVFTDPVVQLAAVCPLCALAALKPEAALAALSPALAPFNPAISPNAALLSFGLSLTASISRRTAGLAAGVAGDLQGAFAAQLKLHARIHNKLLALRA